MIYKPFSFASCFGQVVCFEQYKFLVRKHSDVRFELVAVLNTNKFWVHAKGSPISSYNSTIRCVMSSSVLESSFPYLRLLRSSC